MEKKRCIDIIRSAVKNGSHPQAPDEGLYDATSVIALFIFEEEPKLLFIRKADVEGYPWAGQMAFPGGHKDKTDVSTKHTALRELKEEMGISADNVDVIGSLGHFQTIKDKDIEAWVGVWDGQDGVCYDSAEIAQVFRIPLKTLMDHHVEKGFHRFDYPPNVMWLKYPYKEVLIWGVTAKIVYHLIEVLLKEKS